jgi:D-sedoheptulose 7-phosphate isomerase
MLHQQLTDAIDVLREVQAQLPDVRLVADMLIEALRAGKRLYLIGNGGSALDAQHFAAELVGHFRTNHRPLPAFALTADGGILTSLANDFDFNHVFVRQLEAYGMPGDVLIVFSTSGNSQNALEAINSARSIGMSTLVFAGNEGGKMRGRSDYSLFISSKDTARIQEAHLVYIHLLSELIDAAFPSTQ